LPGEINTDDLELGDGDNTIVLNGSNSGTISSGSGNDTLTIGEGGENTGSLIPLQST
jgi:hypothetical protein